MTRVHFKIEENLVTEKKLVVLKIQWGYMVVTHPNAPRMIPSGRSEITGYEYYWDIADYYPLRYPFSKPYPWSKYVRTPNFLERLFGITWQDKIQEKRMKLEEYAISVIRKDVEIYELLNPKDKIA